MENRFVIPLIVILIKHHHRLVGRAMLGLQRLGPETPEVRFLMKQLAKRISESDRTVMTSSAIADSIYGLQGIYLYVFYIYTKLYLHLNVYMNVDTYTHTYLFMFKNVCFFKYIQLYIHNYIRPHI
jgi:hypothetical protein